MESLNSENKIPKETEQTYSPSTEKVLEELLSSTGEKTDTIIISSSSQGKPVIHHTKNLYPVVRHILLILTILFFITLIVFLMHQNGKSIYDNGL